jgi:hypothetical protein
MRHLLDSRLKAVLKIAGKICSSFYVLLSAGINRQVGVECKNQSVKA